MGFNLYLLLPFTVFFLFVIGSLLSLLRGNHYLDLWFSTAGLFLGLIFYMAGTNTVLYWYRYALDILVVLILTLVIITRLVYQLSPILAIISSYLVFLTFLQLFGIFALTNTIRGISLLSLTLTSFFNNPFSTGTVLSGLIVVGLIALSSFLMRKQIRLIGYRVIEMKKVGRGLHVLIEANLFFFSLYILLPINIPYFSLHSVIALYFIYLAILVYLHITYFKMGSPQKSILSSATRTNLKALVLEIFGALVILSVYAPWWIASTSSGKWYMSPLNFTPFATAASIAPENAASFIMFYISALLLIVGGITLLALSRSESSFYLVGGIISLSGFLAGLMAMIYDYPILFGSNASFSIFYGYNASSTSSVTWGFTSWVLVPLYVAILIIGSAVAMKIEYKAKFFGILGIITAAILVIVISKAVNEWQNSFPLIPLFFILYSLLFAVISCLGLFIYYVIRDHYIG